MNPVIKKIRAALPQIDEESERLDEELGIDRSSGTVNEASFKRAFTKNQYETRLKTELFDCEYDDLLEAEALYYFGRDRTGATYEQKLAEFRDRRESKEEVVHTLISKLGGFRRFIDDAEQKLLQPEEEWE